MIKKALNTLSLAMIIMSAYYGNASAHVPMMTEHAETLPRAGYEVKVHAGYMYMSDGKDFMTEQMYEFNAGYGITKDLSLYIKPFYKVRKMEMVHSDHLMIEESSGIGDTDLYVKYRFWRRDMEETTCQQALIAGAKLPTGDNDLKSGGARLMQMVQPGTGSLDYFAGLAATRRKGNITIDADAIYKINTENQYGYKYGNLLSYDIAGLYQMQDIYASLELNGRLYAKDEINGAKDAKTGGHEIFVTPGISYHIIENLMLMAGVQLPIFRDVNGTGTDYHIMGGVHWFF